LRSQGSLLVQELSTTTLCFTILKCNKRNNKRKSKRLNNLGPNNQHLSHMFRVKQSRDIDKLLVLNLKMIYKVIWISNSRQIIDKRTLNQFSLNKEMQIVLSVQSSIKSSDLWSNCSILIMWNQIKMRKSSKNHILGKEPLSTTHWTDSSKN
jgi:hypothetical protein